MSGNVIYLQRGDGEMLLVAEDGDYVTGKATGAETDGRYTVYEVVGSPGFGPPLHSHDWQEFFYVLEGEVEFQYLEEGELRCVLASPGDSFVIPAGAAHGFRNPGERPNRFLVVDQPAGTERLFRELGVPVAGFGEAPEREPADLARLAACLPACGIEIVAPPVAPART